MLEQCRDTVVLYDDWLTNRQVVNVTDMQKNTSGKWECLVEWLVPILCSTTQNDSYAHLQDAVHKDDDPIPEGGSLPTIKTIELESQLVGKAKQMATALRQLQQAAIKEQKAKDAEAADWANKGSYERKVAEQQRLNREHLRLVCCLSLAPIACPHCNFVRALEMETAVLKGATQQPKPKKDKVITGPTRASRRLHGDLDSNINADDLQADARVTVRWPPHHRKAKLVLNGAYIYIHVCIYIAIASCIYRETSWPLSL